MDTEAVKKQVECVVTRLEMPDRPVLPLKVQASLVAITEQLDLLDLPEMLRKECGVGRLCGRFRVEDYVWEVRRTGGGVVPEDRRLLEIQKAEEEQWAVPGPAVGDILELDISRGNGLCWTMKTASQGVLAVTVLGSYLLFPDLCGEESYCDSYLENGQLWKVECSECSYGGVSEKTSKEVSILDLDQEGRLTWTVGQTEYSREEEKVLVVKVVRAKKVVEEVGEKETEKLDKDAAKKQDGYSDDY